MEEKIKKLSPEEKLLGAIFGEQIEDTHKNEVSGVTLKQAIETALATLKPQQNKIIRLRFGFEDGQSRTLAEVGRKFNLSRERIRQIEAKSLRWLRHPARSGKLKTYLKP
jgi:RNA polymerase primary sigma factor